MKKVKLKNCGDYVVSPKISTNELSQDNYITTDNMLPNKAGITKAENVPLNLKVTQFLENDILLSNIRPYFKKIWLAEFMGGCSADVLVFRTNENYDSTYIKYCLSQDSFFAYDMAGSKGSKMPRGDKNHILNFELLDLDITNQRKIGRLFSNIDKKIAINNQINAILERVAKAIYEYYFVQFDFPNKQGKPYKSSGGAMRFDSTLNRPIPKDFEVQNLNTNSLTSIIPPNIEIFEGEKVYLPTANIQNDKIADFSNKITYKNRESRANMQPIANSVWFAKMKKSKKVLYFADYSQEWLDSLILSTGFYGLHCKNNSLEYIWNTINSTHFENQKDRLAHGATQQAVNNDDLLSIPLLIPTNEVIENFHNQVKSFYKQKYINEIENQKLKNLRDFLLPLLINAQVQI